MNQRESMMKTSVSSSFVPRSFRSGFNCLTAALLLAGLGQAAHASVLLDENFNDNAASYTTLFAGDADANSIGIRGAGNAINTNTDSGFDSFFGSRFLVIGDNAGNLGGEPNGQPIGAFSMARFDLGLFGAGQHGLGIHFDYSFDTNLNPGAGGARSPDDFFVALLDGSDNLLNELLFFGDVLRNEASRKGSFDQDLDLLLASAGNVYLAFGLLENDGTNSSAVGIDNIQVVPEPGSLALLGMGLLGLCCARRRKA
jgi:hypothetical protein